MEFKILGNPWEEIRRISVPVITDCDWRGHALCGYICETGSYYTESHDFVPWKISSFTVAKWPLVMTSDVALESNNLLHDTNWDLPNIDLIRILPRMRRMYLPHSVKMGQQLHEETALVGQTIRQTLPGLWLCKRTICLSGRSFMFHIGSRLWHN